MSRLSRFLLARYARDTLALFVVASILVWLTQMLRLFDLVTAKGQGLFTLAGQALLTTPPLAREIAYICMAIGLARAFKALQDSRELHSIHTLQRVSAIWSALVVYAALGAVVAMALAHWGAPAARRATLEWQAQVAAELVGQNLLPGRFTEVAPGVVVRIGGRRGDGTVTDFFADDSRDEDLRRTYFADEATIIVADDGFQISLRNGRLQFLPADDKYSEIEFARYELAVDSLTEEPQINDTKDELPSWVLFDQLRNSPDNAAAVIKALNLRFAEGPRILAICFLVAALMAFPHARRGGGRVPVELVILGISFSERAVSQYLTNVVWFGMYIGPALLTLAALGVLAMQLRGAWQRPLKNTPHRTVPT